MIVVVEDIGVGEEGCGKYEQRGKEKRTISSYRATLNGRTSGQKKQGTNNVHSLEPSFWWYSFYLVLDGYNGLDSINIQRQSILMISISKSKRATRVARHTLSLRPVHLG